MRALTAAVAAALVLLPAAPAWAANGAPVALDDAQNFRSTGPVPTLVDALANDSDPDGDTLVYTAVTAATKGRASIESGRLFYAPYLGNTGTDTFTYTVSDGQGNTATATVTATLWVDLPAPGGLTMTSGDTVSATLTWPAATDAVRYQVFRNTLLVGTTSSLTWTDTGLLADRQYGYRIASVNGGGFGGQQSATVYRQPQRQTPAALTVRVPLGDPTTLALDWFGSGTATWNVYRDGVLLTSTSVSQYEDTGLVPGREYSYQVQRAGWSSPTEIIPPSALSAAVRRTAGLSDIGELFQELGGATGALGPVTVPERAIPGGVQQDHQQGIILQADGQPPFSVTGTFYSAYAGVGAATGDFGFPVDEVDCDFLQDSGCFQFFEGGSIWSSAHTPTIVVWQFIEDAWAGVGYESGWLGYPVADLVELDGGAMQEFEDGGVYWSADAPYAYAVSGDMHDAYAARGGPAGPLGYPTDGVACGLRGDGCGQAFQGGYIHWSPATGARITSGPILSAWIRQGWQNGPLGYPTLAAVCGLRGGGCGQAFQGGYIHWSPATGAQPITGPILSAWIRQGWQNGRLGYPTAAATVSGSVVRQTFQGGTIAVDQRSGRVTVTYR